MLSEIVLPDEIQAFDDAAAALGHLGEAGSPKVAQIS
jgi:hypothetical protein